MCVLIAFILLLVTSPALALNLELEVEGRQVTALWSSEEDFAEYLLFYAPYPEKVPIFWVSLGKLTHLEVTLPEGAAYYVAVAGRKGEALKFSEVEYFRVRPIWRPKPGTTWQWQLTQPVDTSVEAEMFDIDLFETPKETIEALHRRGRVVICYFSAGTFEPWRPDASSFPKEVLGKPLPDWPEERWLDIRRLDLLAPILEARLDLAVQKGCDGVEPDNVDAYLHESGFPLTAEDQLRFNVWLAKRAHQRGLSIGLKNDLEQVKELVSYFDWALNEECFSYQECEKLLPFIEEGKAVFGVEYDLPPQAFCERAKALGFSFMKKHWELDAWRWPCWP